MSTRSDCQSNGEDVEEGEGGAIEAVCPRCGEAHGSSPFLCSAIPEGMKREWRSKGALSLSRLGHHFNAARRPIKLETAADAQRVASDILRDVSLCPNTPARATAAVGVLRSFLDSLKLGELEQRITELEKGRDGVYR